MNLGGLAGLGGVYGGYQEAEGTDLQNRLRQIAVQKGQYDLGNQQGADAALAKALPNILGGIPGVGGLGGMGQGPQGGSPMAPPQQGAQMPPQPQQPMGGVPGGAPGGPTTMDPRIAQAFGDVRQSPGGYGGGPMAPAAPGPQMIAGIRGRNEGAGNPQMTPPVPPPRLAPQQMPFTPQQQPQGMPQGQPMGGMQPPQMMDWRGAFQSIVKSNPGAPPGAIIGAMDKLVQLMNPIERAQWMEQRNMLTQMIGMGRLQQGQAGLDERKREFDVRQSQGEFGGRSALAMYMRKWQAEHPNAPAEQFKEAMQEYQTSTVAQNRFFSGPQGNTIRSLNVVVGHLDVMRELGEALKNGELQRFNSIAQRFAQETGSDVPTNFDTAKQIVGAEIIKALGVAGAGTEAERAGAADKFTRASSPEQLNGAIQTAQKLLGKQLSAMRKQFMAATRLSADRFDEMLEPETLQYLGAADAAAASPATGGGGDKVIRYDAQGNRVQQ